MTDRNFDFDEMLESSLAELPPDDITSAVTPWKRGMRQVLVGFALSTITLNFWYLQYILPAIGVLLSLLGFRSLRRENSGFFGCYVLSVIRMIYQYSLLILGSTIYSSLLLTENAKYIFAVIGTLHLLALYICFFVGLRKIREKVGLPKGTNGVWLVVWYFVVAVLAIVEYQGYIVPILLIVCFVLIIRSLFRVMRELEEAGYSISPAKVWVPNGILSTVLLVFLIGGILCGMLFCNSYPMDWQPRETSENIQVERVKNYLLYLGFPEYVLGDMTDEDILACAGAVEVKVDVNDHALNNGRRVQEWREDTIYVNTVYDVKELRITGVGVKLNEEGTEWKIIHHFLFTSDPGFFGTESIKLWSQISEDWIYDENYTGQILYDEAGITYVSPYYDLNVETYTADTIIWGERTYTHTFADFSFPKDGEARRGYLSYEVGISDKLRIVDSWIDYTHQKSPWLYPFMTASENRKSSIFNYSDAYKTIQDAFQYWFDD